MRKLKETIGVGSAVMSAQAAASARPEAVREIRRPLTEPLRTRREGVDDVAEDADTEAFLRASGRNRRIRRGLIPQTRNGWLFAGLGALVVLLLLVAGVYFGARVVSKSPKFRISSSQGIALEGNAHVTRAQMLSVFGEDVDRSVFHVPLEQRRLQMEAMPWVEHATVMRLLPNRLRVAIRERGPVAFARQGRTIGLVDKDGVLLDIPPDAGSGTYSFPVVTGVRAEDGAAARAERMKLFAAFLKDIDADGKSTSTQFSEIDLSNPEDVKALIPNGNSEVLVHFGTEHFLDRYHRFEEHIAEWRTQYPRLNGVDMRYERQIVLQMPPKDAAAGLTTSQATDSHMQSTVAAPLPRTHSEVAAAKLTGSARNPGVHHEASAHAKPTTGTAAAKDAATRKRVEAIKQWMARREAARAAAAR